MMESDGRIKETPLGDSSRRRLLGSASKQCRTHADSLNALLFPIALLLSLRPSQSSAVLRGVPGPLAMRQRDAGVSVPSTCHPSFTRGPRAASLQQRLRFRFVLFCGGGGPGDWSLSCARGSQGRPTPAFSTNPPPPPPPPFPPSSHNIPDSRFMPKSTRFDLELGFAKTRVVVLPQIEQGETPLCLRSQRSDVECFGVVSTFRNSTGFAPTVNNRGCLHLK
mmetsp:Transcript_63492/g.169864  ORF Transcript_63492/g.169864 Transcript_63492/m.169864 type:complete len:222 (-) Transcript_63492:416-1081(-)